MRHLVLEQESLLKMVQTILCWEASPGEEFLLMTKNNNVMIGL